MKGLQHMPSMRDIKGIHSSGARSIPRIQRSDYLELYMLKREKDRLEKEIFVLNKRRETVNRQLNSINKGIEELQKETEVGKDTKTNKYSTKGIKKMAINY